MQKSNFMKIFKFHIRVADFFCNQDRIICNSQRMTACAFISGFHRICNGKDCFIYHPHLFFKIINFFLLFFNSLALNIKSQIPCKPCNCNCRNNYEIKFKPQIIIKMRLLLKNVNSFFNNVCSFII